MSAGRVVAITGGFGTLGMAVARAFRQEGARVVLIDRAAAAGDAVHALGAALVLPGVDLADLEAAQAAFAHAVDRLGRLDVLVNVAGGFRWEKFETGSLDTWDLLYTMNLRTAATACKAALPWLLAQGRGRIVCIGAEAAGKAGTGNGAYAASKAGVARLTEALAAELKDRFITVNAVLPSIIDTEQNRRDMPEADASRWVPPEAIASLITYLASDAAGAITGASIPVTNRC